MTNDEMKTKLAGALAEAQQEGRTQDAARCVAALKILDRGGQAARRFRRDWERRSKK